VIIMANPVGVPMGWARMLGGGPTGTAPRGQLSEKQKWWIGRGSGLSPKQIEKILYRGETPLGPAPETLPAIGRPALGDELNEAAEAEYGAAATRMRRELAAALMSADLQYGAAGTFESGARLQRREEMQQAGMRDLATAFAGIELERAGLAQRGVEAERGFQLQEAQLRMQGEAAKSQMYGQVAASSVPIIMEYIIPFIISQFGGGEATGLPQLDVGWEPGPYSPLGR